MKNLKKNITSLLPIATFMVLSGCDFVSLSQSALIIAGDDKTLMNTQIIEEQTVRNKNTKTSQLLNQNNLLNKINYSNLSDDKSKAFVKTVLQKYGFDNEKVQNYFYYVNYFNSAIKNEGLTTDGFSILTNLSQDGGYPLYNDKLEKKNINFMGTNCRIASFSLMKDFIEIDESTLLDSEDDITIFDAAAIDNFPEPIFSKIDKKKFYTFFQGIPTPRTTARDIHLESIKKYWKQHDINIKQRDGLSLVMLFNHTDLDDVLFIGHIGILMKADEEKYIFLEKLSFDLPYQAIIFDKKSQVYHYFMKKYGAMKSPNTASPFLMENMQLFIPE